MRLKYFIMSANYGDGPHSIVPATIYQCPYRHHIGDQEV